MLSKRAEQVEKMLKAIVDEFTIAVRKDKNAAKGEFDTDIMDNFMYLLSEVSELNTELSVADELINFKAAREEIGDVLAFAGALLLSLNEKEKEVNGKASSYEKESNVTDWCK